MRVINKNYDRSVKEILSKPTKKNPHTRSALASTCHLQQGEINPEYSVVLSKTYPTGGKKTLRICKVIWLVGLLHLQEHY